MCLSLKRLTGVRLSVLFVVIFGGVVLAGGVRAEPANPGVRRIARLPTTFGVPTNVTTYEPSLERIATSLPAGSGVTVVDVGAQQRDSAGDRLQAVAWTGFLHVVPDVAALREAGSALGVAGVLLCKVAGDMAGESGTCYLVPIPAGELLEASAQWDPRMRQDSAEALADMMGQLLRQYIGVRN